MNLSIFKNSQKFFSDNATGILTGVGVVGTVATAVLTSRASFKAAELIGEKKDEEAAMLDLKNGERENRTLEVWVCR